MTAGASIAQGAPVGQTLEVTAIGLAVGFVTAGAGAEGWGGLVAAVIMGAWSGAMTVGLTSVATGHSLGESDFLKSAAIGALSAAVSYGVARAAQAQGDGASGESVAEVKAREQAAGRAANEAQWTQGYGSPRPAVDSEGNPIALTTDYTEEQTKQKLGAAVDELRSKSAIGAIYDLLQKEEGGAWDFKNVQPHDTFAVRGQVLDAGQFGNYFAGYVSDSRFGDIGYGAASMMGQINNMFDSPSEPTFFDPLSDQQLISRGAADAELSYHLQPNRQGE
jgi:hypothetical protein